MENRFRSRVKLRAYQILAHLTHHSHEFIEEKAGWLQFRTSDLAGLLALRNVNFYRHVQTLEDLGYIDTHYIVHGRTFIKLKPRVRRLYEPI